MVSQSRVATRFSPFLKNEKNKSEIGFFVRVVLKGERRPAPLRPISSGPGLSGTIFLKRRVAHFVLNACVFYSDVLSAREGEQVEYSPGVEWLRALSTFYH